MQEKITNILLNHAQERLGLEIEENEIQIQTTRKDVKGDLTLVVFPFVKKWKCSPKEAGDKIGRLLLDLLPDIESFEVVGGFLNLTLTNAYWIGILDSMSAAATIDVDTSGERPLVMVEFASPNTNKPLHLGHLRNIFLGDAVSRILEADGNKVIKTQVINDRGIHICKSMLAWEKFSPLNSARERETPLNTGLKGDKLVGKYYVVFDAEWNRQATALLEEWVGGSDAGFSDAYHQFLELQKAAEGKDEKAANALAVKQKELAKNHTEILKEAKEMLVKWEARDPQVYLLWSTMNGWVYEGFDETYHRMGVGFDKNYYESDTYILGKDVVLDGLKKGIFYKKDDGSVWIDLTDEGLDEKLVLRSDGTSVYMTQDIGTALDRFKDYPALSSIVYTVGNEQDYHFKVLFLILQKLGYAWAEQCFHLSYGMVDLPSGKMKSREGTVVDADDIMAEVVEKATEMTKERGHLEGLSTDKRQELFEMIGLGGLKYFLLKVDPKKRMLFNPEESIDLNGHTGPFIQYVHARIQSLLRKSGLELKEVRLDASILLEEQEIQLIQLLESYREVIHEAAMNYSPAVVANFAYELGKSYNHFYQTISILNEENVSKKELRLVLSAKVADTIWHSMSLMGIQVPDRM
jgi:arginyl-tRNA synthetase